MSKKNDPNDFTSLVHQMVAEGMQRSKLDMNVIEFATELLGVELWPTQRAVLKALYNLPFERGQWKDLFKGTKEEIEAKCFRFDQDPEAWWDERAILQQWAIEGKTTWIEGANYTELVLECGMRGTKTSMTSIPIVYEFWRCMQFDDPAKAFGLLAGSLISFLVLATSEDQAQDTLFAAIRARVKNSPYFQGLEATGKIVVNSLEIICPDKNLNLFAGHSRSAGLVGRTLMAFAIDEGNRFGVEAAGGATGIDMYANVGKGVTTLSRFGSKKFTISSAWCEGDLTEQLYGVAESGGGDHILAFRLATWDMNPEFSRLKEDHPHIQAEYNTRGIEAMRDYAGIRPGVDEQFFNKHAVAKVSKFQTAFQYVPRKDGRTVTGKDGTTRTYSAVDIIIPSRQFLPPGMFSYGHCDPGLKKDSFGFVAGHPFLDPKTGLLAVDVTTVVEWEPVDKGRGNIWMVDYENVEEQLLAVAQPLVLKRLTFDHWNSAMMIQKLYAKGVSTYEFKSSFSQTVQREIYTVLREWINAERVKLPDPSSSKAAAKLYKELCELRVHNGRRIDHPKPKGSKDLSDCLACVVWHISQDERRFRFMEVGDKKFRTIGQIHSAKPLDDLFHEQKALTARNDRLLRNENQPRSMQRRTVVTQQDW